VLIDEWQRLPLRWDVVRRAVECAAMPCGHAVTGRRSAKPSSPDALWAVRAAVQVVSCAVEVSDVDDDGSVHSSDAMRILEAAVGLDAARTCPEQG
jgi:hypothetical protein